MATTGPPPGLGHRAPAASSLPPNPFSNSAQASPVEAAAEHAAQPPVAAATSNRLRPSNCPRTYSRATLLAYSTSPLVSQPQGMAPLRDWYGEWEPYQHKSTPYQYRDSPRRNLDESVASPSPAHADADQGEGGAAAHSGGLIGGALGGFGPKREGGARFGRRQEDRDKGEGGLRLGALPSRNFAPSGKNPFGQISASGTFRPAGSTPGLGGREREPRGPRDGGPDSPSEFRRFPLSERSTSFGKERNRDRDAPPHLAGSGDERPRSGMRDRAGEGERTGNGRDFGGLRDGRRRPGGLEGDDDLDEAGEAIESPRTRRTGGADLASDWRKPSDKDRLGLSRSSGYANGAGERLRGERFPRERGGGGKGVPSWMGDGDGADSPAWMDEDTSSPLATPSKGAGLGSFGRRKEADPELSRSKDDLGGAVDSIQAFKAQMKERERLERERALGTGATAARGASGIRLDDKGSGAASSPADAPAGGRSNGDAGAASSSSVASGPPPGLYDTMSNSHGGGPAAGATDAPPGLPGRSSRFARFFDGRPGMRDPQAAALAAQQKLLESRGNLISATPSLDRPSSAAAHDKPAAAAATATATTGETKPPQPSAANDQKPSTGINIADLFKQASSGEGSGDKRAEGQSKASEADVQSMQKLMAMLQAGGGGGGGSGSGSQSGGPRSSDGRDASTPVHAQGPRPDSVNRMRELLGGGGVGNGGGNGEGTPGSHGGQRPAASFSDDDRSQMASPGVTSPQAPHGYGFPPGFGVALQQQPHQPHEQGTDPRGHHSRVISTSSKSNQQRSQSPAIQAVASPYNDHAAVHRLQQQQQQQQGQQGQGQGQPMPGYPGGVPAGRPSDPSSLGPYGFPSPGPGNVSGGRPPFGMDPRMMSRPPMGAPGLGSTGPGQLPPHIAAALGFGRGPVPPPGLASPPPPPPGGMGGPRGAPPMSGQYPNFPPPFGGRPPPPGMPPQLYQQLMSLPPHLQHQLLSGQGLPGPGGPGPMPGQAGGPRSPYDMPLQHQGPMPTSPQPQPQPQPHGQQPQHQHPASMGSPPPPGIPPVGSQAMNGANLMALLSGAHRGPGGN
ncbi:uncharacterized protein PFL1_04489 [Pseudozyma flocculosa PF-1]|uniref:Uncharacterized protein n=1 Tax=Pseudozyma flocculosa PF-1 TaxID=1277687 RepID=A0A061H5I1_9BASI|nr:uncharacterized protein PFL1_04489 [Pseudozyma flocculosa PF-1]EPQ28162.1 hypothetical protein PFL1_04489 [Pseudozyma flocculosa PF-1]